MGKSYPTKSQIERAVEAARSAGIVVTSVEIKPDGTIRVGVPAVDEHKPTLFDQLEPYL